MSTMDCEAVRLDFLRAHSTSRELSAEDDLVDGGAEMPDDGLAPNSGMYFPSGRSIPLWESSSHFFRF